MSFRDGPRYIRMDYKLELVLIPVTDVDRAKKFYLGNMGFVLIVDTAIGDGQRVVQVVPPGSECAIGFGTGITAAAPGSAQGLHLVVSDIVAARDELAGRGSGWTDRTRSARTTSRSPTSPTRTATSGCSKRSTEARAEDGSFRVRRPGRTAPA
jgi:catechol 2,3-dioxygenase-like lactoylglutathione lyase family enzyme